MSNVAVITARGGSKRIPRKNIKLFRGKPIIAYSIETALQSELFDMVMVSTDDKEISEVSKKYGAEVPFFRSDINSDDHSGTADVIMEVIAQLKNIDKNFENACCIYPTAPFISKESLQHAYQLLKEKKHDIVFPVCQFSYPVLRSLKINEDGKVEMIWPENMNKRSQDLPPAYHDAGQFYWIHVESFLKQQKIYTSNSGAIVLSELQVQDIDNEVDWKIAEMKHSLLFA
ncbi:MAG: pseudaminic acid cytidylyltransferase [Chitinophagaceae bacterium]